VLLKPSGLSPVLGAQLAAVFAETGLPPGVLQFLPGRGADVGEYMVDHPAVNFITFTGSKEVGLRFRAFSPRPSATRARNARRARG
jgi:acyl-CoA reductase-like NAD-dependent aldehyde dehydrogenase